MILWDQSQSITSGINPRASLLGSIPEHQFRDQSQSISSGIYPRASLLGSIPEHQFRDQSKSINSGINPRALVLRSIPECQKVVPGIRSQRPIFSLVGSDPRTPFFNRWDRSQSAKKTDYFHMTNS